MRCSQIWPAALLLHLTWATGGCSSLPNKPVAALAPSAAAPISDVVVLWSEAVLKQDNVPTQQGFTGKIYLFDSNSSQPVTTPGKFVFYAYDDTNAANRTNPPSKPDYRWEVDESELKHLLKQDAVGWCYSIWLPVGEPSAKERRYSVTATFTPRRRNRVISDATLVTLPAIRSAPGDPESSTAHAKTPQGSVRLASHLAPLDQ